MTYIYLVAAALLFLALVVRFDKLSNSDRILLIVGLFLSVFMFSWRRYQLKAGQKKNTKE